MKRSEKWLPIINESGTVYGKIAYSQSIQMKNQYLHPVIRIALVHNGKIFLREKENLEANNKPCLDYPFERHILYNETMDKAVAKTVQSAGFHADINCNYLFRYVHRNEKMQRLVYFYICNIRSNSLLERLNLNSGKWWTCKQIKDNLDSGLFSGFFEKEFEFLESTALSVY
ncbi:MAG: hypothetical protein LBG77_06475 [Dysgonamonadaceae bacterium]|jgi:hypothetical protein|nr:hypothetical protein [Dysgonamonadaceae bacterium]